MNNEQENKNEQTQERIELCCGFSVKKNSNTVIDLFGISEQRFDELANIGAEICSRMATEENKISRDLIEEFLLEAKNKEELLFQAYIAGTMVKEMESIMQNPLAALMQATNTRSRKAENN